MKNLTLVTILFFSLQSVYAQDIITTTDNSQLDVEVVEVTKKYVKYRLPYSSDNEETKIDIRYIKKIAYKNGTTDYFGLENPRIMRPWGFSLGYLVNSGTQGLLFSSDYFVTPKLEIGLDLGTIANANRNSSIAVSGKYHFRKSESTSPISLFAGISAVSISKLWSIQFPIGVHYLSQKGLKSSLSLVPITNFENTEAYFEVRLGYNFKKK